MLSLLVLQLTLTSPYHKLALEEEGGGEEKGKQDILIKGISGPTLAKSQPDSSTTLFLPTLLRL